MRTATEHPMPLYYAIAAAVLASGALVELDLPEKPGAHYGLNALWRRDTRLGPAASWLVDAFREGLGEK